MPSVCTFCGDSKVIGTETCDDGSNDGIGCATGCIGFATDWSCSGGSPTSPSTCVFLCGNSILDTGEQCDDGNTANGDGCSSTCQIEATYQCVNSPMPSLCTYCGDAKVIGTEVCDDGTNDGIGCAVGCLGAALDWSCTSGSTTSPSVCTSLCGNSVLNAGEQCDDGNIVSGDGCSSTCTIEAGWSCSGSPSVCTPICGDSLVKGSETCDDGNTISGDGCSSVC